MPERTEQRHKIATVAWYVSRLGGYEGRYARYDYSEKLHVDLLQIQPAETVLTRIGCDIEEGVDGPRGLPGQWRRGNVGP